jgi:thioredoxin-like negative regulator of GroEL
MNFGQFGAGVRTRQRTASRPSTVEATYATAHWLLSRERIADAAKVFRVLLQIAPRDERGWLGLGECHERIHQVRVAAELYGAGSVIAGGTQSVSVRCLLARARTMAKLGRTGDIEWLLDLAERAAAEQADDQLLDIVARERRRLS